MPKFFVSHNNISNNTILIDGEDYKHISKVLRLKEKDIINITDDLGYDYLAEISDFHEQKIELVILEKSKNQSESNLKITLFQGLPKSGKMESIITQNVELGVFEIVPLVTKYCVPKVNDNFKNKIERWNKISLTASKQSMRGIVPKILAPMNIEKAIDYSKSFSFSIVPYEKEKNRTLSMLDVSEANHIGVFIGSEGGFSENEISLLCNNNILPFTLGKRILRTETAGIVTNSIIMHRADINSSCL